MLITKDFSEISLKSILKAEPNYILIEKVAIETYRSEDEKDCTKLKLLAEKLKDVNKYDAQNYFLKAVCFDQYGDTYNAIQMLKMALKNDRYNTVFLLSSALLYIKSNEFDKAQIQINQINRINPNTPNFDYVLNYFEERLKLSNDINK
jgi:tetratricopeptide (TPR) repeat protein